ncbi:MAG: tRNA lysidine(34) synthetase TilS [Bacillota bacterium]|nr:tRNA lysidine(34) synthetase TilS [Bacillota bacterium]
MHIPDLPEQACRLILQNQLIPPGSHILAAVSGGADSIALLLLLHDLQQTLNFQLSCVHIHHGLRGADADADQAYVREWCLQLAVPFYSHEIPVAQLAQERRIGLELAARDVRREVFRKLADELAEQQDGTRSPVRIALAHHLDDQAETMLMHLGRGAGLDGLTGMQPSDGLLIRPLLACRRADIEAWLEQKQVSWRHDKTNDEGFTIRNRLRHQLLPQWRAALGYDPVPLLGRTAENLSLDRACLDAIAQAAFDRCYRGDALVVSILSVLHPAIQVRVLRQFWQRHTGHGQNLEQVHIQSIIIWLKKATGGQTLDLPEHRRISYANDQIRLINQEGISRFDRPVMLEPVPLVLPGLTSIETLNLQISAEFVENDCEIVYNGAMECFWFERIRNCVVRTRLPGDRIHPWGHSGGKPLKKYLQERKVSAKERSHMVLVADGHEVAWLPGHASGAAYVARSGECNGRRIRLHLSSLPKTVTRGLVDATDIR